MRLRAISRFSWRGKSYDVGDLIECPDDDIGQRLINEGNAQSESAAPTKIETIVETPAKAEIKAAKPAVKKKSTNKKKR